MIDAILGVFSQIPSRPTAFVELGYAEKTNAIICVVHERQDPAHPMENKVARFRGDYVELCHSKYDSATRSSTDVWYEWNHNPSRFSSEEEALCWMILLYSDVGCPFQARTDMKQTIGSSLWKDLLDEMKKLQPVASVMFG